jgi:hypothetical protein
MPETATLAYINRLAVVFDLDDTLAPDTYASIVASCGQDPEQFQREHVVPLLRQGWNEILAKFYCLIQESEANGGSITADHLAKVARKIELFPGVPRLFGRLERTAHKHIKDVEVEFYLVSSGLVDLGRALPIANHFTQMWGCEFYFGERGAIKFIKRIVTYPEKVRYLLAISKGIEPETRDGRPADVYRPVPEEKLHVPLDQMVYVGDGASDLPAFSLMHDRHGIAIGVYKQPSARDWPAYQEMRESSRVQNLAPVDFSAEGELMHSLELAVEQICKRISLRKLGKDE